MNSTSSPIDRLLERISKLLGTRVLFRVDPMSTRVQLTIDNAQRLVVQMDITDVEALNYIDDTALRAFLDSRGLDT